MLMHLCAAAVVELSVCCSLSATPLLNLRVRATREGRGSSLARNDAVIGISTNNTRIHHSHGNITQSYTVHVLCASAGEKKQQQNSYFIVISFNGLRSLLYISAAFRPN